MSRLTGSPFHKPSPFEFPRAPLSPPDTNPDIMGPAPMHSAPAHPHMQQHSANSFVGGFDSRMGETEPSPAHGMATPESGAARFRKMSSIAYHSSGLKDSRERNPQRGSKPFVVVIPPASLVQEHGQLGNTLSSGPRYRLSQGMLMPLFPTMYGQLTAIAREFNFPSTTGLCLYPHFTENGVTMTPRISDDIWPFIWSHVFDASSAPRSSPISGKIEFDIDIRQARWYASWLASAHREYMDPSFSLAPSAAPSVIHHRRGESKTTFHDTEDREETRYVAPTARHVPRKLSLVDRYDMMSIRSGREPSGPASRSALSPPEQAQASAQVLSPIFQEEEPKSAKHDLDSRVKSWRASAVLKPTPLAATGQTSLEPANLPNTMPIDDSILDTPNDELNLADYAWSISSAGPNDYDPMSPMSWDRVPSVHIANRMEGSVCLTLSDCTSFGPSDYTLPSPGLSIYRLPTPDIAQRMYEDCPPTPSTATSWGAPLEWPVPPSIWSRAPSVDLGDRGVFSRPVTPSTATSWGPPSWPSSPVHSEYSVSRSVHLGDRGEYSRPATPSTATSWGAPLSYPPSPTTPLYVNTPDAGHRGFEDSEVVPTPRSAPWGHSWPYSSESLRTLETSLTVGVHSVPDEHRTPAPYRGAVRRSSEVLESVASFNDPRQRSALWGHSWPYNLESLRTLETSRTEASVPKSSEPDHQTAPWALSWPYHGAVHRSAEVLEPVNIRSPSAYPRLVLYQPVYPHFDLYPAVALVKADAPGYPSFNIYPPVSLAIAAPQQISAPLSPVIIKVTPCYPVFDLYPAVYPGNVYEIYPPVTVDENPAVPVSPVPVSLKVAAQYPFFDLYPAVYPHVSPYPQVRGPHVFHKNSSQRTPGYPDDLYTATVASNDPKKIVGSSFAEYPDFNLYPAIEVAQKTFGALTLVSVTVKARYPYFNLYPAVYPNFDLYPARDGHDVHEDASRPIAVHPHFVLYPPVTTKPKASSTRLAGYPVFDLYPAVYPAFNIYPSVERCLATDTPSKTGYPHFELYPALPSKRLGTKSLSTRAPSSYPFFNLYPAVYPFIEVYPSLPRSFDEPKPTMTGSGYPHFDLYPVSGYPDFNLYPPLYATRAVPRVEAPPSKLVHPAQYPSFNLYPAVYPFFDLYPAVVIKISKEIKIETPKSITVKLAAEYPAFNLYPAVYPYFDLWPAIDQPRMAPLPEPSSSPSSKPSTVPIHSRLTHSELHAMVMMERIGTRGSFGSFETSQSAPINGAKTHDDLHHAVFPNGIVSTPSGTPQDTRYADLASSSTSFADELLARRRMSALRTRLPLPSSPSPNRRLPAPPPNQGPCVSSAFETMPTHDSEEPRPMRVFPGRRVPLPRSPQDVEPQGLVRSSSLIKPPSFVVPELNDKLNRSSSLSTTSKPASRKRDSIVSQRVRAYNESQDGLQLTMETLAKFPAPPMPHTVPRVPVPKPLDRSKYQFPR